MILRNHYHHHHRYYYYYYYYFYYYYYYYYYSYLRLNPALVASQVQRLLDNEAVFPTTPDRPFPADFRATISQIFRRLFRVYAHAYHNHYERMVRYNFKKYH